MGISTFTHLLSDEELDLIRLLPDDASVNELLGKLCERPFVDQEAAGETVDVLAFLRSFAESTGGDSDSVRLEQKQKFYEITISGMQVSMRYGKKGTAGQSTNYSGADARQYFEKKIKEKTRGGYKAVDAHAAVRKEIASRLDALEKSQTKKAKSATKHRFDFDKCAELVNFVVGHICALPPTDDEMFQTLFGKGASLGQDVCYGPVHLIQSEAVASVADKVLAITDDQIDAAFDKLQGKFPSCLGALCDVTKERDSSYAKIHVHNLQACVREAVEFNCGLLLHYW